MNRPLVDADGQAIFYRSLGRVLATDVRPGDVVVMLGMGGHDYREVLVGSIYTRLDDHLLVFGLDWRPIGGTPPLWPDEIVPDHWCRCVLRPQPRT